MQARENNNALVINQLMANDQRSKRQDVLDTLCFAAKAGAIVGAGLGAVAGAIAGFILTMKIMPLSLGFILGNTLAGAIAGAAVGCVAGAVVTTAVAAVTVAPYCYFFGKPRCVSARPNFSGISNFFRDRNPTLRREPSCPSLSSILIWMM